MSIGYIYCMTNPAFKDGLVKIGLTMRTPEERRRELASTGVPLPFVVEFAKRVSEPAEKEKCLHLILEDKRVNCDREFFVCPVAEVRALFEMYEGTWWVLEETPKDREERKEHQEERQEERQEQVEREREKRKLRIERERARKELERASAKFEASRAKQYYKQVKEDIAAKYRQARRAVSLLTDEDA